MNMLSLSKTLILSCLEKLKLLVIIQEGVSEAELGVLPLYRFQAFQSGAGKMVPLPVNGLCLAAERTLLAEDAVKSHYLL